MFAAADFIVPTRKKLRIAEPRTGTDLIRIGQRDGEQIAMRGQ